MIFYFAGAYERQAELRRYRDEFQAATGHTVSSRWLNNSEGAYTAADFNDNPGDCWENGLRDVEDLIRSTAIVSFTGQGSRGGRHVEHGMAMALNWGTEELAGGDFRLIVVGPREVIFHAHPDTEVYPDFPAFLAHEIQARPTHLGEAPRPVPRAVRELLQ